MLLSARRISVTPSLLGESPVWDAENEVIYWVDGVGRKIHRHDTRRNSFDEWQMPSMVGSVGLAQGSRLITGLQDGIYEFDTESGDLTPHFQFAAPDERVRFNDGKVDRQGRFLCGTMGIHAEPRGELYRVSPGGKTEVLANGIRISNALSFSPDGRVMYFADSMDRSVRAYRYDSADGALQEPRIHVDTKPYGSGPDGATVDSEGYIWITLVQIGKIGRFDPEGQLDRLIDAPIDMPSCLSFGGPDLNILYMTSIKDSGTGRAVSRHPAGGHMFAIEGLGVTGIAEPRFGQSQEV
ncbi:SMP-30/gluconolactonase/LRE family protein [Falsigemmobacter faecalis]|uniref:SMP-30/gluconolactonase/LRE family protein n=1 Tax=Falsigemmobacter faecalis TaxID=2488730 RepID=A0A3P3DFK9_9RHOB|nr:SMP-30/gluconolactonase/LRE family protein [Falsigemmobacter faecalis]RRH73013.1 SMP-30/gluconolactonase/LRE family protein [Falsigemmobacter faecalis]